MLRYIKSRIRILVLSAIALSCIFLTKTFTPEKSFKTISKLIDAPIVFFGQIEDNIWPFQDPLTCDILALTSDNFYKMVLAILSLRTSPVIFTCQVPSNGVESESCCQHSLGILNLSSISHIYVKGRFMGNPKTSFLIARLYNVSDKHNFCYGLPKSNFSISPPNLYYTNKCSPCVCSAIFDGKTIAEQLELTGLEKENGYSLSKLSRAKSLLRHSRFIPSLKLQKAMKEPSDAFLVGESTKLRAFNARAARQALLINGMHPALHGGTLLGWYRNSSVIYKDRDVDFMIPSYSINNTFYENLYNVAYANKSSPTMSFLNEESKKKVQADIKLVFGDFKSGIEFNMRVRTEVQAMDVDVFQMYIDKPGFNFSFSVAFSIEEKGIRNVIRHVFPGNITFCSTIFFGDIFLVPCEPEVYLTSHYGDWRTPRKTLWFDLPNNLNVFYEGEDWKNRKMSAVF